MFRMFPHLVHFWRGAGILFLFFLPTASSLLVRSCISESVFAAYALELLPRADAEDTPQDPYGRRGVLPIVGKCSRITVAGRADSPFTRLPSEEHPVG